MKQLTLAISLLTLSFALPAQKNAGPSDEDILKTLPEQSVPLFQAKKEIHILDIKGKVLFKGRPLSKGTKITSGGKLATGKESFIKLYHNVWKSHLVVGPKSVLMINLDSPINQHFFLKQGHARSLTLERNKKEKSRQNARLYSSHLSFVLPEKSDIYLRVNTTFDESEAFSFKGKPQVKNTEDDDDTETLERGLWIGRGGRFGKDLARPLLLAAPVLKKFENMANFEGLKRSE